jgi:hypothetical protein
MRARNRRYRSRALPWGSYVGLWRESVHYLEGYVLAKGGRLSSHESSWRLYQMCCDM